MDKDHHILCVDLAVAVQVTENPVLAVELKGVRRARTFAVVAVPRRRDNRDVADESINLFAVPAYRSGCDPRTNIGQLDKQRKAQGARLLSLGTSGAISQ